VSYTLIVKPSAERELRRLPQVMLERVSNELLSLEQQPRPPGCQKLRERAGYRIRVGDYRVIYAIDDSNRAIYILAVGHRREVCR